MLCIPALCVLADPISDLDDAAARAQYAFYTADSRTLEDVLGLIERLQVPPALTVMKEYYGAFGNWKLAQLYTEAAAGKPATRASLEKAAQDCQRHAKAALQLDPRFGEAFAIDAICSAFVPGLTQTSCARSKSLRMAQEIEPTNPRIKLIEVMCFEKDEVASAAYAEKLRATANAFETAPPSRPGKPDWGQAEALLLLGQNYLQRGDLVAARDAIEHALVIAPDYRRAQELLETAATRPR
ncbi:MAG TPA: hypothetical protein VNQ81_01070 [Povalibacter sp.]|nr:hypothetical protein [Povalibacter sp.]